MTTLIDNVLGLERDADALVAAARAEAGAIETRAEAELRARREAIDTETERRIEAFRAEAEGRCDEELAEAARVFEAAASVLRELGADALERQAERVVARLRAL